MPEKESREHRQQRLMKELDHIKETKLKNRAIAKRSYRSFVRDLLLKLFGSAPDKTVDAVVKYIPLTTECER